MSGESTTLESFRQRRGLTQEQLGEALGVSKSYVSRLENGGKPFHATLALRLERLSEGELKAADLCPELKDLLPPTPAEARA